MFAVTPLRKAIFNYTAYCVSLNVSYKCVNHLFPPTQDIVKRHNDDDLNLKTPIGPEPHPSWVYRHNYSALQSNRAANSPVKRSISMLNAIKNGAGSKSGPNVAASSTTSSSSTIDRVELMNALRSKSPNARKNSANGLHSIYSISTFYLFYFYIGLNVYTLFILFQRWTQCTHFIFSISTLHSMFYPNKTE